MAPGVIMRARDVREARMISVTIPLQSQQMAIRGPLTDNAAERPGSEFEVRAD